MQVSELKRRLEQIERSQQRIETKLDVIIRAEGLMSFIVNKERLDVMSIKDTIGQLQTDVRGNKDASDAVMKALQTYAQVNSDLTDQLKAALANGIDNADEDALKQIATDLEANNNELHAAAGPTAAAVVANTPAAYAIPV
jgi:chromosome segregation ATPase